MPIAIDSGPFALDGFKLGHATDEAALTGLTAFIFEGGARAGIDVRGGAPGTRESAALDPLGIVPAIHGLVFTGGSAFGLDAAGGVVRWLEERGIGFETPVARVPIVPAAVIADLRLGDPRRRPDMEMGYAAAAAARSGAASGEGNIGAGTGATVGKVLGAELLMKGGLGMASAHVAGRYRVGAVAVVNAFGDVVDPASGRTLAGCRRPEGGFLDTTSLFAGERPMSTVAARESTTLVAVLTDAPLSKLALTRVARMAHDGFARAIRPVHTAYDGDVAYAISTSPVEDPSFEPISVGAIGAEVTAAAIACAVLAARSVRGAPAAKEL